MKILCASRIRIPFCSSLFSVCCMAVDDIKEREKILDEYYSPPKPKRVSKPRLRKSSPDLIVSKKFDSETIGSFSNMDDYAD